MLLYPDSKAASRLSNVDCRTVFAWDPVDAFCCFFRSNLVLSMDHQVPDSHVRSHGCADLLYTLATASGTPSTYGITTDVL